MKKKKTNRLIPPYENEAELTEGKKAYFLSDVHLGAPVLSDNRTREIRLIEWLEAIRPDCGILFLLGDIFDFWFEYKRAVPKGHIRFLAKICEFTDQGIPVHFFTGNHDIWAFDYLPRECGVTLHTHNEIFNICHKRFLIGHGDGLNPEDKGYLFLYRVFHNPFLQHCFRWLHPDVGIRIAHQWSSHSRLTNGKIEADSYRGAEKEEIVRFCQQTLQKEHFDYFIFGHRHYPIELPLSPESCYINTGDWITYYSYAVFDGTTASLKKIPGTKSLPPDNNPICLG